MMCPNEHDDAADGTLVETVTVDPLRAAFAQAMGALIQALPPGHARDIALSEIISAHERTEQAMRPRRVLN